MITVDIGVIKLNRDTPVNVCMHGHNHYNYVQLSIYRIFPLKFIFRNSHVFMGRMALTHFTDGLCVHSENDIYGIWQIEVEVSELIVG